MLTKDRKAAVLKYTTKRLPNRTAPRKADRNEARAEWRKLRKVFGDATCGELAAWYSDASLPEQRAIVQVMADVCPSNEQHRDIVAMIVSDAKQAWAEANTVYIADIRREHAERLASIRDEAATLRTEVAEARDAVEKGARLLLDLEDQLAQQQQRNAEHMIARRDGVIRRKRIVEELRDTKAEAYDLTKEVTTAKGSAFRNRTTKNSLAMLLRKLRADVGSAVDRGSAYAELMHALRQHDQRVQDEGVRV